MQRVLSILAASALVLGLVASASAGDLKLQIRNGRVTLEARDVTVSQILAEWARVGRTKVVNGDRIPGGLVTLQLTDAPEAQALDAVLRSVSGYVAAPRAERVPDASTYDRIMILATVRAAAAPAAPAPAVDPNQRFRGVGMGRPVPSPDQDEVFGPNHPNYPGNNPTLIDPNNPNFPGTDNPNIPGPNNPNFNPNMPGATNPAMPGWTPVAPGVYPIEPGTNPTLIPVNPAVGVPGTSSVPGVIIQPKPPVKPPGSPGGL